MFNDLIRCALPRVFCSPENYNRSAGGPRLALKKSGPHNPNGQHLVLETRETNNLSPPAIDPARNE
jgi:hypothetical protein